MIRFWFSSSISSPRRDFLWSTRKSSGWSLFTDAVPSYGLNAAGDIRCDRSGERGDDDGELPPLRDKSNGIMSSSSSSSLSLSTSMSLSSVAEPLPSISR